jgi:hypothetical protein
MDKQQLKEQLKEMLFDMEFDESLKYLQEILDLMEDHQENEMDGSPVVYYP